MNAHLIFLFFTIELLGYLSDNTNAKCLSYTGKYVLEGESFSPQGKDECTTCLCSINAMAIYCITLDCELPINHGCSKFEKISGCCQFRCLVPLKYDNETKSKDLLLFNDSPGLDIDYPPN